MDLDLYDQDSGLLNLFLSFELLLDFPVDPANLDEVNFDILGLVWTCRLDSQLGCDIQISAIGFATANKTTFQVTQ